MVSDPRHPAGVSQLSPRPAWSPNLPAPLTALLGREEELAVVSSLLLRDDVRLLSLTGPAGVGKTRLAVEAAHAVADAFRDGCQFVSLALATDANTAIGTIAHSLRIREAADGSLAASLAAHLRSRTMLLVLDNLEQALAAAPALAELLALCPEITMLTTSRAALRLRGERLLPLQPLPVPDQASALSAEALRALPSVRLFAERAAAAMPDFTLSDADARTAGEICRRLDGLPLAIELAASAVRALSPAALLARLDRPLETLAASARDLPPRQRTLRSAIDWSYVLLEPDEQALFRRLGVFAGGCTLESALAVCDLDGTLAQRLAETMAALVEVSLLRRETAPSGEVRFAMLVTIRQFALERLAAAGELDETRRRHAAWALALAERADAKPGQAGFSQWQPLDDDLPEIRAVLSWAFERGETTIGLRIVGALTSYWESRGILTEAANRAEALLAQPGATADTAARAGALYALGRIRGNQGRMAEAEDAARRSVAAFREVDAEDVWQAGPLSWMGCNIAAQGDAARFAEARAAADEGVTLARATGDSHLLGRILQGRGYVALFTGEPARAGLAFAESEPLLRASGDEHALALLLTQIGMLNFQQGDDRAARARFVEAAALGTVLEDRGRVAIARLGLGYVALHAHDLSTAAAFFAAGLAAGRELGSAYYLVPLLEGWASLCSEEQRFEEAARLMGAAAAAHEATHAPHWPGSEGRYEHAGQVVVAQLGEEAFAILWAAGRMLSLDQAAAEALRSAAVQAPPSVEESTEQPTPATLVRPTLSSVHLLTARELEVLRLIAAGCSNPEIAAALVLSVKTVERHLSAIYQKIDARGRVDAAAYALRHGLA